MLNAVNEVAVAAFLERSLSFLDIAEICAEALARLPARPITTLDDALEADAQGRALARELLAQHALSA
jgi:1-deoxy-D-xylulose-5-phosphate reductoisomerase